MAQHYFDLSIGRQGEWPTMMRGERATLDPQTARTWFVDEGFCWSNKRTTVGSDGKAVAAGLSAADVDVIFRTSFYGDPVTTAYTNTGPSLFARASGVPVGGLRPADGYELTLNTTTSVTSQASTLRIFAYAGGTGTDLGSAASRLTRPTAYEGTQKFIFMRLQCVGGTIRGKCWNEGSPEPATWQISATNSAHSSGDVAVYCNPYGAEFIASWLTVGTDTDLAPLTLAEGLRTLTGQVEDAAATLASRTVRAYSRSSGVLLGEAVSDPVTGIYSIQTVYDGEVDVVCLDDTAGDTLNDLILRTTPA